MIGENYMEPVVLVKKKELDALMRAYDLQAEESECNIVQCGKCGTWHVDRIKCPNCHTDPDDEQYPCKEITPIVTILDSNFK